ncbi:mechanosensitive ion channel family protein [Kushneria indalinina]|uniref:Small-conductance mechanosensitive channel n=1 Tax=Kushneria indalinina DSM 14324 TaxID=1122140 RepID=A0A3D9DZB3_9GAMM|nr:mechanosensitive ion channel family protein [Kushneria indalinina]REC95584.1 small-conductance mechanosensitive channel [Kushneria indalinina DSM 14324]
MKANDVWRVWLLAAVMLMLSALCVSQAQAAQEGDNEAGRWFSVESLNTGLGEPPDHVQRGSPRETMRSLMELTQKEDFAAAAHILNLSELSPQEQREKGERLVQELGVALRRGEWLRVSGLSGRQDAAIEDPSGQNPRAGVPRRNIELASFQADGETYDVRLARYRVDGEEPVWLIMPDTVSSIPLLYDEYGPSGFEDYIPDRLKTSLGMLKAWEWIAIPIVLPAIALLGWAIYNLAGLVARWLPEGGSRSFFTDRIRGPLAFIVMSLATQMLLDYVVSFSAVITTTLRVLLILVLGWAAGIIALRLVDTIMVRMMRRFMGEIDDTSPKEDRRLLTSLYAMRRIIILIMVTAVSVFVLSQIQIFETLGLSILASASVGAVLVGIAGQAVLSNILSSFQLALAKPIRIGDLVMFEDQWCYVEGIFYTFIRLRVWNERRLLVPVTYFASKPFENMSAQSTHEYRCLEMKLHLSADIGRIREKFVEFAKEEDSVVEHDRLLCYVTGQTDMAQTIACYLMTTDPMSGWTAEMLIRERLLAFVRDNHPEWWPREVMAVGRHDVAFGNVSEARDASADRSDSEQGADEDVDENTEEGFKENAEESPGSDDEEETRQGAREGIDKDSKKGFKKDASESPGSSDERNAATDLRKRDMEKGRKRSERNARGDRSQ